MSVLVLAELQGTALAVEATAKAVAGAKLLGDVVLLVAGPAEVAAQAAKIGGVSKVLHAADAAFAHQQAESLADLVLGLAGGFTHIAAPATAAAKNALPRVAALLDVMIVTDVIKVIDAETFARPVYAGNAVQTVRSRDAIKVLTLRTTAFKAEGAQEPAPIEALGAGSAQRLSTWVQDAVAAKERPELTSAGIVVSGGRALGSEENFALVEALADKLGAAVGASRAAVDAGFAENDLQVGQTGKVVAPDLYIAVGISGAIQHLAGMKDSRIIVAINKDEEAPIFQVADYGLVGDLFEILPELTAKIAN